MRTRYWDVLIRLYGWYGAGAILAAYGLNSFGVVSAESVWYQALNLTGALGIVCISLARKVYPPAVLNIVWCGIAVVALLSIIAW